MNSNSKVWLTTTESIASALAWKLQFVAQFDRIHYAKDRTSQSPLESRRCMTPINLSLNHLPFIWFLSVDCNPLCPFKVGILIKLFTYDWFEPTIFYIPANRLTIVHTLQLALRTSICRNLCVLSSILTVVDFEMCRFFYLSALFLCLFVSCGSIETSFMCSHFRFVFKSQIHTTHNIRNETK